MSAEAGPHVGPRGKRWTAVSINTAVVTRSPYLYWPWSRTGAFRPRCSSLMRQSTVTSLEAGVWLG
jgi:hypothetical protein